MEKKNRGEIEKQILIFLDEKPLSIQQLSKKVSSNWATINEVTKKLKLEGSIKEVVATDKIKIFRKTDYPVFYGIPIEKKYRDDTYFIMHEIIKKWREIKGGLPYNTTLQKIAVEVIKKGKLNLPVLPLHYGLVSAIGIKPQRLVNRCDQTTLLIDKKQVIKIISQVVPTHKNDIHFEENKQYDDYNLTFFKLRKEFIQLFKDGWKNNKITKLERILLDFSIEFPTENLDVYDLFDRFLNTSIIIVNSNKINDSIQEIKETFDLLWDLVTASMYLSKSKRFVSLEDLQLFNLIKTFHLNSKIITVDERVSNLESTSDEINLSEVRMLMDEESISIRKVLTESIRGNK